MKSGKYKFIGWSLSIIGLITLISFIVGGLINQAVYSTLKVHGDYWLWGYIIIPLIFVLLGVYYLRLGMKQTKTNKWIDSSAIIQSISLIIGIISILLTYSCTYNGGEWCGFIFLLLGIPISILMVIGIILLIIGLFIKSKNPENSK